MPKHVRSKNDNEYLRPEEYFYPLDEHKLERKLKKEHHSSKKYKDHKEYEYDDQDYD